MVSGSGISAAGETSGIGVSAVFLALALALPGHAQHPLGSSPQPTPPVKERFLVNHFPDKPSLPVAVSIPLDPLGFTAPGPIYLGSRNTLVSLDFLDENRLLFTFRVPGLIHRDPRSGAEIEERQIRAVVLTLPQGTVLADALWTVHDRVRYLWMLADGHFIVRDKNNLLEGDPSLVLKPLLDFPGDVLWLELDPAQQLLVTNSHEPVKDSHQPDKDPDKDSVQQPFDPGAAAKPGEVGSPVTASATVTTDDDSDNGADRPNLVVRIIRRDSGQVMLVSRVRTAVHLPINSVGYLENLRGRGMQWMLNLDFFSGGTRLLGNIDSNCEPDDNFVSEDEILAIGCGPQGETRLEAMTTTGRVLWLTQTPATEVWPQLTVAPNGSRLALGTLDVTRSVNSYTPLDSDQVKEQSVTVFDAASGDIALVSPLSPILDAGGNVAISPSGRRVALLNAGAIQVFDLPAPTPLPAAKSAGSSQ
jgi:hypothetical protein